MTEEQQLLETVKEVCENPAFRAGIETNFDRVADEQGLSPAVKEVLLLLKSHLSGAHVPPPRNYWWR